MENTCQAIKGFNNLADMVCELGYQGEGLCNVQHIRGCSVLTLVNNAISAHRTLLTDTLISGQLYLQQPSENPFFLSSHTKSEFLYSCKQPAPDMETFFTLPRVSAHNSFQCSDKTGAVSVLNSFKKIPGVFPSMHFSLC